MTEVSPSLRSLALCISAAVTLTLLIANDCSGIGDAGALALAAGLRVGALHSLMLWCWGITVTDEAALDAAVAKLSAPEGSRGPSSPRTITLYGVAEESRT